MLALFTDTRLLLGSMVVLAATCFLANARPQAMRYVRWLAGSMLSGGALITLISLVESRTLGGALLSGPTLPMLTMLPVGAFLTGFWIYFGVSRHAPAVLFLVIFMTSALAMLLVDRLSGGWVFSGASVVATVLTLAALTALRTWWRERWAGLLWLAWAMLLYPALLVSALDNGLSLSQFRLVTPAVLVVGFILVIQLVLQRDAAVLQREVTRREGAQRGLAELAASLEQQVKARTDQLTEVNEGLRSFAGLVSHDLRAPLRNIQGLANAALEGAADRPLDTPAHDTALLQRIRSEAQRASDMVHDLLTLSMLDQAPLDLQPTDFNALVTECLGHLGQQFDTTARVCIESRLPVLPTNRALMVHAVSNLLGNALKFGQDRADLQVRVSAVDKGSHWRFQVQDNGPGFEAARRDELFKAFSRLEEKQVGGIGLGLVVVRRVIERHGGSVQAVGLPGQGATFSWTLPKAVWLEQTRFA